MTLEQWMLRIVSQIVVKMLATLELHKPVLISSSVYLSISNTHTHTHRERVVGLDHETGESML